MPYAQTTASEGISMSTINLEGLLLTKQTLREKDVLDRSIERALAAMLASRHTTDFDSAG